MRAALLLLVAATAYIASVLPFEDYDIENEKTYPRYIYFPDGDGVLHPVDLEKEPNYDHLTEIERDPANNQYLLFTIHNNNTAQNLVINNATSISCSNYNPNVPTVVVVHGFLSNRNSDINLAIRDGWYSFKSLSGLLANTETFLGMSDVNIIVLDWGRLANTEYTTIVSGIPSAGRTLGLFVRFLINTTGGSLDSFHFVGFSLGAHLVGNAGRELEGKVARITGLDPAGPLWSTNSNKLNRNDAVYVEAIHTSVSSIGYGIGSAIAKVDFFPNWGCSHQPGCLENVCDHTRAWELFAATVTYNHLVGAKCTCFFQVLTNKCCGTTLNMGNDDLNKFGLGMYRLETETSYPF